MQAMPSVNLWPAAAAPALRLSSWDMTWMTVWSLPVLSRKYYLSYHKNPFKVLYSLDKIICLILKKLSNVPFIVTGKKSPSQLSHIHPRFAPASPTRLQNIPSKPSDCRGLPGSHETIEIGIFTKDPESANSLFRGAACSCHPASRGEIPSCHACCSGFLFPVPIF